MRNRSWASVLICIGLVSGAATAALIGCQVLVSDTAPVVVECTGSGAGICAGTDLCVSGRCVPRCDAAACEGRGCDAQTNLCNPSVIITDGSLPPDGPIDTPDASNDATDVQDSGGPKPDGERCGVGTDCASKLCASDSILTSAITNKLGGSVCTSPCCTSADCAAPNTVCFGAGTGGSYCVPASALGRAKVGSVVAGGACNGDSSVCRSGSCVGSPGVCADTCCKETDCKTGSACQLIIPGGTSPSISWNCVAPLGGTRVTGDFCSSSASCKSASCVASACRQPCSATADCPASPAQTCTYVSSRSMNQALICYANSDFPPANNRNVGTACSIADDCKSGVCDLDLAAPVCASACRHDADCSAPNHCKPLQAGPLRLLRCSP